MAEEQEETGDGAAEPVMPDGVDPPEDEAFAGQSEDVVARAVPKEEIARSAAFQNLQAENEDLKERNLLLLAEMAACRQRLDRDKEEFKKYAISGFAGDVLCVADNMRRTVEAMPKELLGAVPALKGFVHGVEATERLLLQVLNRYRVTRYDPLGEAFNPHFHDAKTLVNIPDVPANTVVHVICAGYMIGDRVLRPAEVAVAGSGDEAGPPPKPAFSSPAPPARDVAGGETAATLFRRLAPEASGGHREPPPRAEEARRKPGILHKSIISASDGIPAATHPIWERLVTGQIKHRFKMFAANLLVDRARREYAAGGGAKAALASEISTFCNRYASLLAVDLEPLVSATGKIPAASHPIWELLVTGQIKHRFKMFAANLLIDRAKRVYANNRDAKARLAAELCKFFNEHADLTAPEFEKIASEETTWQN